MIVPMAHLAGWLWTVYLVPVLIVLVPLVKGQINQQREQKAAAGNAGKKRSRR